MKRLSMLVVLVTLMGINGFAQTRTAHVKTNLGIAKPSLLGTSLRIDDCDTFANLCDDDSLAIWTTGAGGYVSGQNGYGDISKADIFALPGYITIKGVLIYFGVGKAANTVDNFKVRIWDNDGTFNAAGGGGSGAPGTILGFKALKYSVVAADVTAGVLTYVQFTTPINVPADGIFYAGIDFGYKAGDTVAIVSTLDRAGKSCDGVITSVEQWDPAYSGGGWIDYGSSWGFNGISNMILPVVCKPAACSISINPTSATICKGKKQNLTASGATTYTWAPATGLDVTTGATVSAKPTSTTTYTVTGDGGACSGTVTVTVNTKPTATVTQGACTAGHILLTRNGTPTTGVTYKWKKDGVNLTGAASTASTYNASISGSYQVKVTITATGCTVTSKAVDVVINCKLGEDAPMTAEAYPNPFTKSVSINIASGSTEPATVKLMDFSGRILHEYKGVDTSAPFEINENLAPGVYFVRVNQGTNEKMIKVVKD